MKLLLKKGEKSKIERTVNMESNIEAPVKAGQKVGNVVYSIEGKEVGNAELVASNEVQRASFIKLFFRMVLEWFGVGRTPA